MRVSRTDRIRGFRNDIFDYRAFSADATRKLQCVLFTRCVNSVFTNARFQIDADTPDITMYGTFSANSSLQLLR